MPNIGWGLSCGSLRLSTFEIRISIQCRGPVNQKFSFSVFGSFNISFEPEYGNLNLETRVKKPQKNNVFHFQFCFSAIPDFIIWFCTSLSSETWSLNLFFSNCSLILSSKRRFSNSAGLGHFLVYFNKAVYTNSFILFH